MMASTFLSFVLTLLIALFSNSKADSNCDPLNGASRETHILRYTNRRM